MTTLVTKLVPRAVLSIATRSVGPLVLQSNDPTNPTNMFTKITTNKSLDNTRAAGSWSVTFIPRLGAFGRVRGQGTVYHAIRPGDFTEIRLQGGAGPEDATEFPPVVMRGIVTSVNESIRFSGTKPQHIITVEGQDLGYLFNIAQIWYTDIDPFSKSLGLAATEFPLEPTTGDTAMTAAFKLFLNRISMQLVDLDGRALPISDLIKLKLKNYLHGFGQQFFYGSYIPASLVDYEGSFWNFLQRFVDYPFQELFVIDEEDSAKLWLRSTYFKQFKTPTDRVGQIWDGAIKLENSDRLEVPHAAIVSFTLSRSESSIYNLYFAYPTYIWANKLQVRTAALAESVLKDFKADVGFGREDALKRLRTSRNPIFDVDSISKFGFRPLELELRIMPIEPPGAEKKDIDEAIDHKLTKERRDKLLKEGVLSGLIPRTLTRLLHEWYRFNADFETGQIVIPGNAKARIGQYLDIIDFPDQNERSSYYIIGVRHEFVNFTGPFTTTLTVTRGDRYMRETQLQEVKRPR